MTCPVAGLNLIQPLFFYLGKAVEDTLFITVNTIKLYTLSMTQDAQNLVSFAAVIRVVTQRSDPNNNYGGDYPKPYPVGRYILV